MNSNEEDLQKSIESGTNTNADDLDVKAYEEVIVRLRKKPDEYLSAGFADRVIVRIEEKQRISTSQDFVWLAVGVFVLMVSVIVASVLSGFRPGFGLLKVMSGYAGVFAFGVIFILLLNRLDKKLLPKAGFRLHS